MKQTTLPTYETFAAAAGRPCRWPDLPVVCVQGLGFVGAAMAAAVASAMDDQGKPCFNVIGVDLDSPVGRPKIDCLNAGQLPMPCNDQKFVLAIQQAHERGNLVATSDVSAYQIASTVVVDVPFDIEDIQGKPSLPWGMFKSAVRTVLENVQPGTLILVETTVPPGTCEKVVAPEARDVMARRGLPEDAVLIAHSYERVMPGDHYFDSIVRFWRVYAGLTPQAAEACRAFLSRVIDVDNFPLTQLANTTASETAKVLENSYRATTIAFIEEWGRFAESVGIDLFEVIRAIRIRPTHSNMRQPGFGVGGYCLTKDPLMARLAAKEVFQLDGLDFPFSSMAVKTNHVMPLVTLDKIEKTLGGLAGKHLLLLGVSYRSDVGDTRYSPSETFVLEARRRGGRVDCHDPLLTYWPELDMQMPEQVPSPDGYDAVVFAVGHAPYRDIDIPAWAGGCNVLIFDANCVLSDQQLQAVRDHQIAFQSIGRG